MCILARERARVNRMRNQKTKYMLQLVLPDGTIASLAPDVPFYTSAFAHEAGHALVALHFGVRVLGIGITQWPERGGLLPSVSYGHALSPVSVEDECTIYAGGAAGELVACGKYTDVGVGWDKKDAESLSPEISFETAVERAKRILIDQHLRFERLHRTLCERAFQSSKRLPFRTLPDGRLGVFLLRKHEFY
jgi:hypothetical protein